MTTFETHYIDCGLLLNYRMIVSLWEKVNLQNICFDCSFYGKVTEIIISVKEMNRKWWIEGVGLLQIIIFALFIAVFKL